jgi:hypothetical protein
MTRGVAVARETQRVREYLCVNGLYDKILVWMKLVASSMLQTCKAKY